MLRALNLVITVSALLFFGEKTLAAVYGAQILGANTCTASDSSSDNSAGAGVACSYAAASSAPGALAASAVSAKARNSTGVLFEKISTHRASSTFSDTISFGILRGTLVIPVAFGGDLEISYKINDGDIAGTHMVSGSAGVSGGITGSSIQFNSSISVFQNGGTSPTEIRTGIQREVQSISVGFESGVASIASSLGVSAQCGDVRNDTF